MNGHLNTAEAAKYLGYSIRQLERWRQAATGPVYKQLTPNGTVWYSKAELDRFLSMK